MTLFDRVKEEAPAEPVREAAPDAPLADRMRPRTLDELVGQASVLGPKTSLGKAIRADRAPSVILWGPPGCGKTTVARVIAAHSKGRFVQLSAVLAGVAELRAVVAQAEHERRAGRRTVLFVDEIHRFNRAQQDALLPHVESGLLTLIGATTENPSFEINGALLSRMRVFVLQPLDAPALEALLDLAMTDADRGLGGRGLALDAAARELLAQQADGDARRALTVLDAAALLAEGDAPAPDGTHLITPARVEDALQQRIAIYDKSGEQHFNLISAYHKALRGSDPQGALYWLARMIDGGEDPLYIARRTVRFAAEDVGLSDPRALEIAIAARDAFHFLGSPEGELALAEAAVYLATAPKSNRIHVAWKAALQAARDTPAAAVPMHIRNAPTTLMKELGYGAGYQYAHDAPDGYLPQDYLPDEVAERVFYEPGQFGFEKEIEKRLAWWRALRDRLEQQGTNPGGPPPTTEE